MNYQIEVSCSRPGCRQTRLIYKSLLSSPSQNNIRRRFCSQSCRSKYYSSRDSTPKMIAARKKHKAPWLREQNLAINSILGKNPEISAPRINGRRAHRVIAERKIKRKLRKGEVVHHKNGDHLDNDPGNLQVMLRSAHISLHQKEKYDAWKDS